MKFDVIDQAIVGVNDDDKSTISIPFDRILAITQGLVFSVSSEDTPSLDVHLFNESNLTAEIQKFNISDLPYYIDPRITEVTVINSKTAGKRSGEQIYANILRPLLKELGIVHKYISTESKSTISAFAESLTPDRGPHTVILLSGDTSIHELINSLQLTSETRDLIILPIPTGSGNALMTSLSLATPFAAIFSLLRGTVRPLNAFYAAFPKNSKEVIPPSDEDPDGKIATLTTPDGNTGSQRIFSLVVVSWAIHAALVGDSDSPEYRKLGNDRFKIAAKVNLERGTAWHGKLSYLSPSKEGGECERSTRRVELDDVEHSYVLTTSISSLEPGFKIAPTAKPLTGNLELVRMPLLKGDDIMRLLMLAYQNGAHVKEPEVLYTEIDCLYVRVDEEEERMRRWCVDGRIIIVPQGSVVEVHRGVADVRGWRIMIAI
ncbi:ATP-NAD kinase-like domain-containing protein [Kockiozyma suomiensis]|uniref:ATP-NAD kinase-like domain-containing protein n=1 Tax=Kockiozyma suomiensis TaxID=1337062 RepID=UPI003343D8DC